MKINIPSPCTEDWNAMKIGLTSRHCDSCAKNVMDFTQMRREAIIEYLLSHSDSQVCGRIKKNQVDFTEEEIIIAVRQYVSKNPKTNRAFLVLALGAMLAASCQNAPSSVNQPIPNTIVDSLQADSTQFANGADKLKLDTNTHATASTSPIASTDSLEIIKCGPDNGTEIVELGEVIVGDVMIESVPPPPPPTPDSLLTDSARRHLPIVTYPEVQAEFQGGVDSLFHYINTHLVVPDSVVSNGLEGRIYVRFQIDFDGAVSNVEILRDQIQNRELQENIAEVILAMPRWKPAEYVGSPVNSQFVIPIRIRQ